MKRKLTAIAITALGVAFAAEAQNSFAIIVDTETYEHCKNEIEDYRESVTNGGLDAFVLADDWKCPQQIKDTLIHYYNTRKLEGTVFIGDIPIAMVRQAQHFTSAFKMDETAYPKRDTSVPSDRFYDDFDLKFNFVGRDSLETNFFYYNLAPESPQVITCDIYSGRIKPSSDRGDKYEELSGYLKKVVRIKKESNTLDKMTSYTGDGSFSNSLIAWKDETITLGEQMPQAFKTADGAKFYAWCMYPYLKEHLIKEIQRDELDFIFFHEHGIPERQYLTGYPKAEDLDEYYELGKFYARNYYKRLIRRGRTPEKASKFIVDQYGIDSVWFTNAFEPEMVKADSLFDANTGLLLDDIARVAPNVRVALFDACYNGDYRESDCVATRYIMSGGNTIACLANSVNVLQDKSSSDLLGMLSAGYSVGQWQQQIHILESHVIGDPTFAFKSVYDFEKPDLMNKDVKYWKKYLDKKYPCDIQGLALHNLFKLEYEGLSDLLLQTYMESDYYMLRLQCMHLLAHYNDGNYTKLLLAALDDPYEFIRRKGVHFAGMTGDPVFVDKIAQMYLNEYNTLRVCFNIEFTSGFFEGDSVVDAFKKAVDESEFVFDKEAFYNKGAKRFRSGTRMRDMSEEYIKDKSAQRRGSMIGGMRNMPYPMLADALIGLIKDNEEKEALRVRCAEVLGWYVRANNRAEIVEKLQSYLDSGVEIPDAVKNEVVKTNGRLKAYMR